MTIQWNHWPRSAHAPELCRRVAEAFVAADATICSPEHELPSNKVLAELTPELKDLGFRVEIGKSKSDKVFVPVLYGLNGEVAKHFDADAYHESAKMVLEVEAGRAVSNNQFLKDLFWDPSSGTCTLTTFSRAYLQSLRMLMTAHSPSPTLAKTANEQLLMSTCNFA